jgi:hypothetical protein
MARNILDVWSGDRLAMAKSACDHAHQFSWQRSMDALFGQVYPAAFEKRRQHQSKMSGEPALAA